jgi:hypothetical protein
MATTTLVKESQSLFSNSNVNSIPLIPLPASSTSAATVTTTAAGAVHPTTLALYKNINAQTTKSVTRSSLSQQNESSVVITNEIAKVTLLFEPTVLNSVAVPFR